MPGALTASYGSETGADGPAVYFASASPGTVGDLGSTPVATCRLFSGGSEVTLSSLFCLASALARRSRGGASGVCGSRRSRRLGCPLWGTMSNGPSVPGLTGSWSELLGTVRTYMYMLLGCGGGTYRRLLRLSTSHVIPSTEQLAHGGPDNVTVHLTLRKLQALHATAARLKVRIALGDGATAEAAAEAGELSLCCGAGCCCCCWDMTFNSPKSDKEGRESFLALSICRDDVLSSVHSSEPTIFFGFVDIGTVSHASSGVVSKRVRA